MSLLVLAWTFCVCVYFVIAAPNFAMKAAAIPFASVLSRAMNSLIIVLNDKGYRTYLSREVNCGIFGSLGVIPGSMTARIEHGQKSWLPARRGPEKIPVLRSDFWETGDYGIDRAAKNAGVFSFMYAAITHAAKDLPTIRSSSSLHTVTQWKKPSNAAEKNPPA
jgi:hypothetical protein